MKHIHAIPILLVLQATATSAFAESSDLSIRSIMNKTAQAGTERALTAIGPSSPLDFMPDARLIESVRPTDGTNSGGPELGIKPQISASNDDTSVSLKVGWSVPLNSLDDDTLGVDTWGVAISAPLGKSGTGTLFSNDGWANDFLAKLSFTRTIIWSDENRSLEDQILQKAEKACVAQANEGNDLAARAKNLIACRSLTLDDKTAGQLLTEDDQKALVAAFKPTASLIWGIDASAGYKKFDFFDALTAAPGKSTGTQWSVGAHLAYALPLSHMAFIAGAQYGRKYSEGDTGTLCPVPTPTPPVLTCVTGAIGAPTVLDQFQTTFEFKTLQTLGGPLPKIGIDAKFAYDTKSDVYSFDVPVSFVSDSDGNLIGGVEFGWRSDKHDIVAGLFLSSAFSL